jgi:hypothetical protein
MPQRRIKLAAVGSLIALAVAAPGSALAYNNGDAVRDCESRVRNDYGLFDMRESFGVQLPGEKNYRVEGKTKVDGVKYPWSCEIANRRVIEVVYNGPQPSPRGGGPARDPVGVPEVVPRRSGELEVRMPSGCTALYDRAGELLTRGRSCSPGEARLGADAVARFLREQGVPGGRGDYGDGRGRREDRDNNDPDYETSGRGRDYDDNKGSQGRRRGSAGPEIDLSNSGSGQIRFESGCTVSYRRGQRTSASPDCSGRQIDRADNTVDDYLR